MLLNCKCTDSADTSEEQLEQPPVTSGSSCSCFLMDFQTADGVEGVWIDSVLQGSAGE